MFGLNQTCPDVGYAFDIGIPKSRVVGFRFRALRGRGVEDVENHQNEYRSALNFKCPVALEIKLSLTTACTRLRVLETREKCIKDP